MSRISPYRWLALGDSYTIGEGVIADERWPAQLARLLAQEGVIADPPRIVARTGWTAGELAEGIEAAFISDAFDLVTICIGVNNQYRNLELMAYDREFELLLDLSIRFAGGRPDRVVVLSIPDWGVTPFAVEIDASRHEVAVEIDAFNAVNRRLARDRGCHYVDVTGLTRAHRDEPDAWASDGLHPSPAMYARWVQNLHPLVRSIWGIE